MQRMTRNTEQESLLPTDTPCLVPEAKNEHTEAQHPAQHRADHTTAVSTQRNALLNRSGVGGGS